MQRIRKAGKVVFHSVGDTGERGAGNNQDNVVAKMQEDFNEATDGDVPSFFFHLGDVVYSFGAHDEYYDQFFDRYRDYPAPIFAIAGNHDGLVASGSAAEPLDAFLANFCAPKAVLSPDSKGLSRKTMTQPGVYFSLDAPNVRIIGLYSNVLENPGVISNQNAGAQSPVDNQQLDFLTSQFTALRDSKYQGAIILAVHHPPYTGGGLHGPSPGLLADLETVFSKVGLYPHCVLSGHAHNHQRFTREITVGGTTLQIPFIVAGNGGHGLQAVPGKASTGPLRPPHKITPDLTFESAASVYGYLRIVVSPAVLRLEFHDITDNDKTPSDHVNIDIASRTLTTKSP